MSPRNKNNEMDAGDFGSRKGKSDINVELQIQIDLKVIYHLAINDVTIATFHGN